MIEFIASILAVINAVCLFTLTADDNILAGFISGLLMGAGIFGFAYKLIRG